jgi:hypothetical protein
MRNEQAAMQNIWLEDLTYFRGLLDATPENE